MEKTRASESRRKFLKAVPVAVAGAVTTKAWAQGQQTQGPVNAEASRRRESRPHVRDALRAFAVVRAERRPAFPQRLR